MEGRGIPCIPGTANGIDGSTLRLEADIRGEDVPVNVVADLARDLLATYPDLFGVRPEDLRMVPEGSGPVLDYLYFLNFQWTSHGIPVDQAYMVFRLNHGNLVQIGQNLISPEAMAALDPWPSITLCTAPNFLDTDKHQAASGVKTWVRASAGVRKPSRSMRQGLLYC
jgi:hypothetical protein